VDRDVELAPALSTSRSHAIAHAVRRRASASVAILITIAAAVHGATPITNLLPMPRRYLLGNAVRSSFVCATRLGPSREATVKLARNQRGPGMSLGNGTGERHRHRHLIRRTARDASAR
jgi:hypothetical protein